MKIICTKAELAQMLAHCVTNVDRCNNACRTCPLYEKCEGAYIDTLTSQVQIEEGNDHES